MTQIERLYGQLIVGFANAQKSDGAASSFFENVQRAFSFSSTFAEKAKRAFPQLSNFFSSRNDVEVTPAKQLFDLLAIEKILRDELDESQLFLSDVEYERSLQERALDFLTVKDTQPVRIKIEIDDTRDLVEKDLDSADVAKIREFIELTREIIQFRKNIPETTLEADLREARQLCPFASEDVNEHPYDNTYGKLTAYYRDILEIHDNIIRIQVGLRNSLEKIVEGSDLKHCPFFEESLAIYNGLKKEIVILEGRCTLRKLPIFNETDLLDMAKAVQIEISTEGYRYMYFREILALCLVDFLIVDVNKEYIRKCQDCQNYYIAKTLKEQRFCSTKCQQRAYHSRSEVKSKKAAARREKYGWQPRVNAN